MEDCGDEVNVQFVAAEQLGLTGQPVAEAFAERLLRLADENGVRVILLDGPQAWKSARNPNALARECERVFYTPGKTGLPLQVVPRSWTRMAVFSVAMFDALHEAGWSRLSSNWSGGRVAVESFPTSAWRSLGERALPGKARKPDVLAWVQRLSRIVRVPSAITHDELQAVVAGLAGVSLLREGLSACDVAGTNPVFEDGYWREGLIANPARRSFAR